MSWPISQPSAVHGRRSVEISDAAIQKAEQRMRERLAPGPHAVVARYDRRVSRVMVTLSNGLELAFPPHMAEGLADAKPADLAVIEITPAGLGLHWPRLDADPVLAGTVGRCLRVGALDGRTARQEGRLGAHARQNCRCSREWPQGQPAAQTDFRIGLGGRVGQAAGVSRQAPTDLAGSSAATCRLSRCCIRSTHRFPALPRETLLRSNRRVWRGSSAALGQPS